MLTFDDLKKKQLKGNTLSTPAQSGAGAFQNTQNQSQASWNDTFNPLAWAWNTGEGALKAGAADLQFGGKMLGDAWHQGGDTLNEIGGTIGSLGSSIGNTASASLDMLQGKNGPEQTEKIRNASRDLIASGIHAGAAVGHGMNTVGNVAGAALSVPAAIPVAAAGGVLNAGRKAAEGILPDQTRAVEGAIGGAASNVGKSVGGALTSGLGAVQGKVKEGLKAGQFSEQQQEELSKASVEALPAVLGAAGSKVFSAAKAGIGAVKGAGEALSLADEMGSSFAAQQIGNTAAGRVAPLLRTLGESGIAKAAQGMARDAAAILSTPKSMGGGWLDATAQKLKQGGSWLAMKAEGVPIPENIPFKQVADRYVANRVGAFYNTPLGQITKFAGDVAGPAIQGAKWSGKLAYQVSPLNYGVWVTKRGAQEGYRMSKYGYDAVKTVFGKTIAKEISDVPLADDALMQATGLAASDQYTAMQNVKDLLKTGIRDEGMSDVRDATAPLFKKVNQVVADTEGGMATATKAYQAYTDAVSTAGKETIRAGMGQQPAFYENTRNILNGLLTNTLDNPASPLRQELEIMAKALGKQQTTQSMVQIQQRLNQMLQGKGVDMGELARNTQALGTLHNTVTNDLMLTLGHYDEGLGASLVSSHNAYKYSLTHAVQGVGDRIAAAPSDAAKTALYHKEYLQALAGHGAEVVAPLASHIDDIAGDFFRNGAMAFHGKGAGTLLEKSPAWRTAKIAMGDEPKDVIATGEHEFIKTQRPNVGDKIIDTWITASSKAKNTVNSSILGEAVVNTKSEQAFENFARGKRMDPTQPKIAMHGDATLLGYKDAMADTAVAKQGLKGGQQPIDVVGRLLIAKGKTLEAQRDIVGTVYRNAVNDAGLKTLKLGPAFDDLVADIEAAVEVGVDANGKAIMTGPYLRNNAAQLQEIQDIFDQFKLREHNGEVSLANADKIQQKLDALPAKFDPTPTGKESGALQNAVKRYRESVHASLPPEIQDIRADYAKTMDAYRTYYKWLGVPEKEFNRFTIWNPPVPGTVDKGFRELIDSAEKKGARNIKKLLSDKGAADAEKALNELSTITSGPAAAAGQMDDFLNIARFDDTIASLLTQGKNQGFFENVKRYGITGAVVDIVAGERSGLDKLIDLQELIKNQKRAVEKDSANAYFMRDTIPKQTVSPAYGGLSKPYALPEDTKFTSGYGEETTGQVIPDHPTTVAPGVKQAARMMPNTPPSSQNTQQPSDDNLPF